jgi:arsenate reductase
MKKLYYLSTCSTCQRIIKVLDLPAEVEMHDIKQSPISAAELDHMKALAGSYEALFSRKAMKYRALGLHEHPLSEMDYRKWILEEYTFLKRPVLVWEKEIFAGNQNSAVEAAKRAVHGE